MKLFSFEAQSKFFSIGLVSWRETEESAKVEIDTRDGKSKNKGKWYHFFTWRRIFKNVFSNIFKYLQTLSCCRDMCVVSRVFI